MSSLLGRRHAFVSHFESTLSHPLALFLAAAATRTAIVLVLQLHQAPFRAESHRIAASLATTGVYGNEYIVQTGPSAHSSPAHTLLLAAVFRLFGIGVGGEVATYALNIALASLIYAVLPWVAVAVGIPRRAGVAAGWFGALVPFHFLNEIRAGEEPLAALALMGILVSARRIVDGELPDARQAIGLGIAWGFSLLVLPTLLCVIAAIIGIGLWLQRTWSYVVHIGLAAVVAILILSPWAIRNRLALGETVWFRSNLGTELRLSYNDFAWPDIDRNSVGGAFDRYYVSASVDAARQLRAEGEVAYNRRQLRESIGWVRDHPTRALSLLLHRTFYFWFPRTARPIQSVLLGALSLLGLASLLRLRRDQRTAYVLLLATWGSFPIVYYVIQSAVRYRYPMIWTLLLASATLLVVRGGHQPLREGDSI